MTNLQSTWSTSFVARLIDTVKQQDFTVAQMEMIQHVQGQNHIGTNTKMNFHCDPVTMQITAQCTGVGADICSTTTGFQSGMGINGYQRSMTLPYGPLT